VIDLSSAPGDAYELSPVRRRLCVVTVIDRLMTSGAEIVATRIAMGLDRGRFESIICSTRRSDPADITAVEAAGARVLSLDRRSRAEVWRWRPLLSLLRSGRVDVLHAHKFASNVWAGGLAHAADVPVVLAHEHTWSFSGNPLRRLFDREFVARSVDLILCVSDEDRRRMIEVEGIRPQKVRTIPNGIPPVPRGDGASIRQELGIPAGAPTVGTICGLRAQKAVEVLIEAVARLAPGHPGLRVLIVGDGPERDRLERLVSERGLGSIVLFLGQRSHDDVPHILDALDVAVSSSDFEGAPLSVLEWMAAGKAIVATAVGGVPSLIEHGTHGLLVPPRDADRIAAAIGELLDRPTLRTALGVAAAERQRAEFALDAMLERLQGLYLELYRTSEKGRKEAWNASRSTLASGAPL
jgi:glycosyltransferase involved in cell wall biosynthesis